MPDDRPESAPTPEDREQGKTGRRGRLLFAAGLGAALVAGVVVVLVVGSDSSRLPEPSPAPEECVQAWNADRDAVAFGVHNYTAHQYSDVQVTRLTERAREPAEGERGLCAVVFARSTLDPEPGAAGQVLLPRERWVPLSDGRGVDVNRLTTLQSDALQLANAELLADGTIEAR